MPESKGHLNPGANGVSFDRFELGADLVDVVRHVWVVRWELPAGRTSLQRVLTYPALNAVFVPGAAALYPPDSQVSTRELSDTGWAVGVLFRPAAGPLLTTTEPARIPASGEPIPDAPTGPVDDIMVGSRPERAGLTRHLSAWLRTYADRVDHHGRLVNAACALAESDTTLMRAGDLADRLAVSPRALERLVRRYTGMTPKWLIECRRLQYAATTLFENPSADLSVLAAELGYTDYAHFSRRYRRVLGETPHRTARAAAAGRDRR